MRAGGSRTNAIDATVWHKAVLVYGADTLNRPYILYLWSRRCLGRLQWRLGSGATSLVPSRPQQIRMWRHLPSLSGKFAEDYRTRFQASSGNSDSANWPGYEAAEPPEKAGQNGETIKASLALPGRARGSAAPTFPELVRMSLLAG